MPRALTRDNVSCTCIETACTCLENTRMSNSKLHMWGLRGSYLWGLNICVGQEDREGADQIL